MCVFVNVFRFEIRFTSKPSPADAVVKHLPGKQKGQKIGVSVTSLRKRQDSITCKADITTP